MISAGYPTGSCSQKNRFAFRELSETQNACAYAGATALGRREVLCECSVRTAALANYRVYKYGKMIARKKRSIRQVICLIKVCVGARQYNNDNDVMAFYSNYEYRCASQRMYV